MTTLQIQKHFFSELSSFYPKNELDSIWNLCLDFVLVLKRNAFITHPEAVIDDEKIAKMEDVIARLKNHEPIQYITQKSWFCDSIFNVNPAVLIPRPETEELIFKVIEAIGNNMSTVLDIGTGSGCIAICIKRSKPMTRVVGVDISEEALKTATSNAEQIVGADQVTFIKKDVLEPDFAGAFDTKFDIIVSNPPYIPIADKETLTDNVLKFEPHEALFCGDDPLLFYKAIATQAHELLKPGGLLFFEIHEDYGPQVKDLLIKEGFKQTELIQDFQGKDRMIKAFLGRS